MVNLATRKILMTPAKTQIPFQYYGANPFLAAADSLAEGMVTEAVTVDGDVDPDTETYPRDFLPQYSPSR